MKPNIIIIDDEKILLKQLRRILEKEGCQVSTYSCPHRALSHMENVSYDLVISDIKMPGINGMQLMTKVKTRYPHIEVILITGYASLDGAIEATKEGAFYYLSKPFNPTQAKDAVRNALNKRFFIGFSENEASDNGDSLPPLMIGKSNKMLQIETVIKQIAPTNCNVLITGDSGTGKELIARTIHARSDRANKPFVAFNCGALSETLIDNELFGHERGAYTGADSVNVGLLESANGGTVFLDEIGEMPASMQVKLLRVIQEKELMRVGGRRPIPVDVRIFSATAKDIETEIKEGSFRKDLYYRVNVVHIKLPVLNERKKDIPLLVYHILNRGKSQARITSPWLMATARSRMFSSSRTFPGNS